MQMRVWLSAVALVLLTVAACDSSSEGGETESSAAESESHGESEGEAEGEGESEAAEGEAEGEAEAEAMPTPSEPFEGVRGENFESERFNVRFTMPTGWSFDPALGTDDSVTITGPDNLQLVIANSQSVTLADTNFSNLNDRVSFEQVNIVPDRTQAAPVNGMPAYRVEGDALLRGDGVPIYFISQAVSVPGDPVMITIYIPGDYYDLHSDTMKAVLDSVEPVAVRPAD